MNINSITWGAATIILTLIVHISVVLAIPYLSENDAWRRLINFTEPNQMRVLEKLDENNQLWAFHAPDIKYAVCRYDITRAPVRIHFTMLRGFWSVALYDDEGRNFYAADGFDLLRSQMSLILLGPDDIKGDDISLPIKVPSEQGLIVLRAPVDNQVMAPKILELLKSAKCELSTTTQRIKR